MFLPRGSTVGRQAGDGADDAWECVAAAGVPVGVDAPDRTLSPARDARPDVYRDGSYWWHFQRLLDAMIGPGDGWAFPSRQRQVRAEFDVLEKEFATALPDVRRSATARFQDGRAGAARELLREFTAQCADRALTTADRLRTAFESADS